ncbi:DUF3152 domain-containing protein [Streptomyces sp. NPDC008159]|uniref:DUF3152 domain-containing protein n=1 Tax=Streptomyces sp. NPDC008159 TaxID=3364817 RepID=UPI0036E10F99
MTERRATPSPDRRRRSGSAEPAVRRAKGGGRRRKAPARSGRDREPGDTEDGVETGRESDARAGNGGEGGDRAGDGGEVHSRVGRGRRARHGRRGKGRSGAGRPGRGRLWGGLGAITVLGAAGFAAVGWAPADRDESAAGRSAVSAEPEPERSRRTSGAGAGTGTGTGADGERGRVVPPSASPSRSTGGSTGGSADESAGGSTDESVGGGSRGSTGDASGGSAGRSASPSPSGRSIPETGPGTFTRAPGSGPKVGDGKVLRYRVEVEKGLSLSAADVAEEVERILGDPRGWTADGDSAFQRVSGGATDFVVKVATPGTVDDICGAYGLNTGGEVNCNVDDNVMVNLKRWELATPVYADDVTAYRALIINHEVGHFLGEGHVGCPGRGKPAPAMMQQIKGMKGCVPNVWPYDAKGRLITGPAVP